MKWVTGVLVLASSIAAANVADAQFIFYGHKSKHSAYGIGLDFGGGGYGGYSYGGGCGGGFAPTYYAPPAYYAPPVYYAPPAYGYHEHATECYSTPYGTTCTTTYHYAPVHYPYYSQTYSYPYYYWP